jgi:hypothetical protein
VKRVGDMNASLGNYMNDNQLNPGSVNADTYEAASSTERVEETLEAIPDEAGMKWGRDGAAPKRFSTAKSAPFYANMVILIHSPCGTGGSI